MDKPHQCSEMKAMRGQLRTASPEGRNQIAKRISKHYQTCEQCAEWWEWVWASKEVPAPSSADVPAPSPCEVAESSEEHSKVAGSSHRTITGARKYV